MAKDAITDYSATASNNTDIGGISILGSAPVSNFDGGLRELMAQLADMNAGTSPLNDTFTLRDPSSTTKKARFDVGNVTAGQTRVFSLQDRNGTVSLDGDPFVILSTGQSNAANERVYAWSPEPNAYLWNSSGSTGTGTAFEAMNSAEMNYGFAFANMIAKRYPNRPVYLVVAAVPGLAIANWLPGAPTTDVYDLSKDRIEAALATISATKIDLMLWWQGESDAAAPTTYVDDFNDVIDRYRTETWFPYNTPVNIMGVVSTAINGDGIYGTMNLYLQKCAAADPQNRKYFYTPGALEAADWLDVLHPTGQGYERVGIASAQAWLGGAGSYSGNGTIYNPETGFYGVGSETLCGVLWDVRKDANSASVARIVNLNTGNSADASMRVLNNQGTLNITAYGAATTGVGEISWSGTGTLDIKATAASSLRFYIGSSSENARMSATGFNLLTGDFFHNSQKVVSSRRTGWAAATGTATRTTFATGTVTTAQLAERVKALVDDLIAHGLIGA